MVSRMTKEELVEHVRELEGEVSALKLAAIANASVNTYENLDSVTFGRDPQVPGGVLLTALNGVIVITPKDWIDMVCEVSVGGNNGTNQAIVRNLHLG